MFSERFVQRLATTPSTGSAAFLCLSKTDMLNHVGLSRGLERSRIEFDERVGESDLRALANDPGVKVLQCSVPVPDTVWRLLNTCFFVNRPDVELRIYGHYAAECDLRAAQYMTNVRRFAADCLMRAHNIDCIAAIPDLQSLSLGIFELADFRILDRISPTLTSLSLGATLSKKPSLGALARLRGLEVLYVEGQSNGIEVIAELEVLKELTLRSIDTPNLTYLAPLPNLWSLDIKLGCIKSFEGVEGKESIKSLQLWQIRGLREVGIFSSLPGLQKAFLQSLPCIKSLPSLANANSLRRVVLQNLKGMADFATLDGAPALEEFLLLEGRQQFPEQLVPVLRNPNVRRVGAFFGSETKNHQFSVLRSQYRKALMEPGEPFAYW